MPVLAGRFAHTAGRFPDICTQSVEREELLGPLGRHAIAIHQHLDAQVEVIDRHDRVVVVDRVADHRILEAVSQEGLWIDFRQLAFDRIHDPRTRLRR